VGRLTVQSVLVVGGGGREHALAWALARSPQVEQVFVAPGNAGTQWFSDPGAAGLQPRAASSNVPIAADDIHGLIAFAREQNIRLTVVGPEAPLALGIVDSFQAAGLRAFGPSKDAAQLEWSKTFSKAFMRANGIPTAEYETFTDYDLACAYARGFGRPVVVKADGLAAGKGVMVCDTPEQAEEALRRILVDHEFGAAGTRVIVEERLEGEELSVLAFSDGENVEMMPFARDHKRAFDGDQGPNTGGMGAYAPVPGIDFDTIRHIHRDILVKTVARLPKRIGAHYVGVLYAGLMLTADGPKVLEFNCRFGDPETQAVLPLLNDDLYAILDACVEGRLDEIGIRWNRGACASVVLASPGYPGEYPTGLPISGLEAHSADVVVFHAGTADQHGQIVTAGGRVLAVSGVGADLPTALRRAYAHIKHIHFEGMRCRRDVGQAYQEIEG
jgi:phosphoribosylamine--glycine ligase